MKQPNILLKVAAVASALLLVGGFVSYRAGAFNRLLAPSPASEAQPPLNPTQPDSTIMGGSKDLVPLIVPASSNPPPAGTTQSGSFIIMSGSKSDAGMTGGFPLITPAPQPPVPSQPSPPPQ